MIERFNIAVLRVYDYERSQTLAGGMERWCRDVALLARDKGYDVTIYQKDSISFNRELTDGVRVVGVQCGPTWRSHLTFARWIEKNTDINDPFLFVSMELALTKMINRIAAIQHGICWEGDFPRYKKLINKYLQYKLINKLRGIICVDTNYINWCHAEYPNRVKWQHKLCYIPNYADPELFQAQPEPPKIDNLPTILFPRRVFGSRTSSEGQRLERDSRGAGLLLNAVKILKQEGTHVRVIFAGRGVLQNDIGQWAQKHEMEDRISIVDVPLDKMPELYTKSHVAVIPSLEREGTSLSAIEAIMSGVPTVVSHIGGLGNIVIDGVNGFICDLTPESLAINIRRALEVHRLPVGPTLASFRDNLGKPRWENQVWAHLSRWLELK